MKNYYDIGYTILLFSIGLYAGDFLTDRDGQSSIIVQMGAAVLILIACFVFDVYSQWRAKNK